MFLSFYKRLFILLCKDHNKMQGSLSWKNMIFIIKEQYHGKTGYESFRL